MDLETLAAKLKRKATIFHTGGYKPLKTLGESWIARIGFQKQGEEIPKDCNGKQMHPLAMLFTGTAPFVPEEIKQFKLITVFIGDGFWDHMVECDFEGHFEVREYTETKDLVPCEYTHSRYKAFPLLPELVEDYPQWDSGFIPEEIDEQIQHLEDEELDDYEEHIELYPKHKLGGYPYYCQSGFGYAGYEYVFQIASDEKAGINFVDSGNLHFFRNSEGHYKIYIDFY